jgi:glycosyltransferase involved in cell wall biosynthesis
MKIAVYTIALNEEQFVERWYESAKEADYLLIADTGSTDQTVQRAESLGIKVVRISVQPWRFDDARNASLAAIPADVDYCIALDMDEILLPGWRKEMESLHPSITRPRYQYTWSWQEDGSPGLTYGGDKIHARKGYRWKHPVHEVLTATGVENQGWFGLQIHHHPDSSKSRSQYLPLLELAIREMPEDDRNTFYYARELYFDGQYEKAKAEFKRHLKLPNATWEPERAASMRYLAKVDFDNREMWLQRAVIEAPRHREARVELAQYYYEQGEWDAGYFYATSALKIKEKPLEYLCDADSWGYLPHDLAAICAYRLGLFNESLANGRKAVELAPYMERLKTNLTYYEGAINNG